MRGISFVHVPTSLMGMVDAAIGGKTAVDLGPIKNRVGLFSQPEAVIIDRGFLQTLPEKEYRNGMAEVLKHAFISDVELLKNLNDEESLIERSVRVKSVIVRKDEHETGERRKLNFGHTIGHAIESHFLDQGKAVTHGEAVAAGMLMEAYISSMVSGLTETDLSMVCQHIDQLFPRIELSDTEWHMIKKFLYHDKKNRNGKLQFVLLKELGKAEIDRELREDVLNKAFVFYTSVK